jgi:hypothetical protein
MRLHRRFAASDEVTTTGFYLSNTLLSEGMNPRAKSLLGKIQLTMNCEMAAPVARAFAVQLFPLCVGFLIQT